MSDFLKNLRSTQRNQRSGGTPPTRKDIDGQFFPNDRRKIKERRIIPNPRNQEPAGGLLNGALLETLPVIKDNMTQIAASLERIAESRENLEKSQIKQHNAVGNFFINLNKILEEKVVPFLETAGQQVRTPPRVTTSYASGTHHTKDEVIDLIQSMRRNQSTFAEIAEHLTKEEIPTFSGRGDWHAQTIHRLCK